jgi:hypothetical protein
MGLLSSPWSLGTRVSHSAGWDWSWGRIFANRVRILANTFTLRVDEKQIDRGRRIVWKTLAGVFFAHAGVNGVGRIISI